MRLFLVSLCMWCNSVILFGCDLTSLSLNTIQVFGDGSCLITMDLCLGAGITGLSAGADGDTYDIALGIYDSGPVNILAYSPDFTTMLQSQYTGCSMPGYDIGPVPAAPFFTQATIYYSWDPFTFPNCTNGFTCITSTAQCGNLNQECFTLTMNLDVVPDSIRLFGAEGAGNPIAGCYPNNDLLITFPNNLSVNWGNCWATKTEDSDKIEIHWETLSEKDNDHFMVQRYQVELDEWKDLAMIKGFGTTDQLSRYSFTDISELSGEVFYRITQTDVNGNSSQSKIVSVYTGGESVRVYPIPVSDEFRIEGLIGSVVEIFTADGIRMHRELLTSDSHTILVNHFSPGIYFLRAVDKQGELITRKIIIE